MLNGPLAFFALLAVLITVHELGHFLVAKWAGVKVLKFSIGFGPRIVGFKRGETEYRLGLLPLGGYVKMAGELPAEDVSPDDAARSFLAAAWWKRAGIVVAGPAFNLVFPILVYFVVFWGGVEVVSTRIGVVEPDLPAAQAGMKAGDRVLAVDGEPVRSFEEMRDALQNRFDRPIPVTIERAGQSQVLQVTPVHNVEHNPVEKVSRGLLGVGPISRAPVLGVAVGSPAALAGLRSFDRVLKVNGQVVRDELEFGAAVAAAGDEVALTVGRESLRRAGPVPTQTLEVVEAKVARQAGEGYAAIGAESYDLYVWAVEPGSSADKAGLKAGDKILSMDGAPIRSWPSFARKLSLAEMKPFDLTWTSAGVEKSGQVAQAHIDLEDDFGSKLPILDGAGIRRLGHGALFESGAEPDKVKLYFGPVEAMGKSLKIVPDVIRQTALAIGKLFTGGVSLETVGGPIMLYQYASKASEQGFDTFLRLMAAISVNLGLMNLLPVPVLDGFALLAALWEGIRRRPIPVRAREVANLVGLVMLAMLFVLVMKNDIFRTLR